MTTSKFFVVVLKSRPYLWGDKAVEHHAVKQNLSASLNKQASTEQVLDALDRDTLYQSCLHFPISMKMHKGEIGAVETLKCSAAHFDPRFLLPLFSHLVAPGRFEGSYSWYIKFQLEI